MLSDKKYFAVEIFETRQFMPHFVAYCVSRTSETDVISFTDLFRHSVLHLHHIQDFYLVTEKDTTDIECTYQSC